MENESDFEEDECDPRSSFPDRCENEKLGIEILYKCFIDSFNACPIFFIGSLYEACQEGLDSNIIERRPVLVYIHSNRSTFSNIFCSKVFCSEMISDYLMNNYLVWPWDITLDSNRDLLKEKWSEVFPCGSAEMFVSSQCPMLIGIMRRSNRESSWRFPSNYEYEVLVEREKVCRTNKIVTDAALRRDLIVFKGKYDENEKELEFDFIVKTNLCLEVFLEIINYLNLNDAVKAFSDRILPTLSVNRIRLQLFDPSLVFLNMIRRRMNLNEILSLKMSTDLFSSTISSLSLAGLTSIVSLTLFNLHPFQSISSYINYLPHLIRLSLSYDNEFHVHTSGGIWKFFKSVFERSNIHCDSEVCPRGSWESLDDNHTKNFTIKYLLIDIGHIRVPSLITCSQNHQFSFLESTILLIQSLRDVRQVRFLTNEYNLPPFLNADHWRTLLLDRPLLNKIRMDILKKTPQREQLLYKAAELQMSLQTHYPTVQVQFVCL